MSGEMIVELSEVIVTQQPRPGMDEGVVRDREAIYEYFALRCMMSPVTGSGSNTTRTPAISMDEGVVRDHKATHQRELRSKISGFVGH